MTVANPDGNIEIHPGPRGHSVVSVGLTPDGKSARFTTDEPRVLNPVRLPDGPKGEKGNPGLPGEGKIVTDDTAGHRVFMWDARLAGHQMAYGDTGVRLLADGTTWVRRTDNLVETNALDPVTDLPAGFRPISPEAVGGVFTTADEWPSTLPGTEQRPPVLHYGLRDYDAAVASGYPGTAEEWLNTLYRVVLPPSGKTGQVLTRTAAGSAWMAPPAYGPGPWLNITLNSNWRPSANHGTPQVRLSAGTVEMIGNAVYTGPDARAGIWSTGGPNNPDSFLRIGNIPPGMAPEETIDTPVRVYRGLSGPAGVPMAARVTVSTAGAVSLAALSYDGVSAKSLEVKAGVTSVSFSAISYPLRNSSPTA